MENREDDASETGSTELSHRAERGASEPPESTEATRHSRRRNRAERAGSTEATQNSRRRNRAERAGSTETAQNGRRRNRAERAGSTEATQNSHNRNRAERAGSTEANQNSRRRSSTERGGLTEGEDAAVFSSPIEHWSSPLTLSSPRILPLFRHELPSANEEPHFSESDPDWNDGSSQSNSSLSDISDAMDVEDNSQEIPTVLSKPKPRHKWFAVKEILRREVHGGKVLRERYYGSLHVVQRLELMYKMDEHSGCVNAVNFAPSGSHLISGSDDRSVCVWDWPRGRLLTRFPTGHSSNVFQCKYMGGGVERIVTCSRDGQVRLAECCGSSWKSSLLASHSQPCHKLTTLPTSHHVFLTAGEDSLVYSIDIRQPKANKLIYVKEKGQRVSLYSIHANPLTGYQVCVAGEDCYVRIYDRRNISRDGQTPWKLSPPLIKNSSMCYVTCAVFNYNGTEVIGSYNDDDIYLFEGWNSANNSPVPKHRYEGHRNSQTVKGVNFFGPKSEYVISGSDCGNIYIWDKDTEAIVQFMRGDEDGVVNSLEPHPHIPILATSGLDSDVKIWIPSCEHEPVMKGLKKTLKMNQSNREMKFGMSNSSGNELVFRLWSQMRPIGRSHLFLSGLATSTPLTTSSEEEATSGSDTSDDHFFV